MEIKDFFHPDQYDSDRWECVRCGALIGNIRQHFNWHHSVDTTATVKVPESAHSRP